MKEVTTFLPYLALALIALSVPVLIVRSRVARARLGARESALPSPRFTRHLAVLACAPVLAGLLIFRRFDPLTTFAVCGVAVLGFWMSLRELLVNAMSGIYENGIAWSGVILRYADVDDLVEPDPVTLVCLSANRAQTRLVVEDAGAMDAISRAIREKSPALR
ncbi:MAG TPA: hypothetical protein PLU93_00740 [Treponemataceae bacterium]|jgi:hypothetical protein|nr:hypothetical protein [Treponemataceae bacterium]